MLWKQGLRELSKKRHLLLVCVGLVLVFQLWNAMDGPNASEPTDVWVGKKSQPVVPVAPDDYVAPDWDDDDDSLVVSVDKGGGSSNSGNGIGIGGDTKPGQAPPPPPLPAQQQKPLQRNRLPPLQFDFGPEPPAFTTKRVARQNAIKDAFLHAWRGYSEHAMGHDELKPVTNGTKNPFGHWGATLIDSLSTMVIMDLDDELQEAVAQVSKSTFETDEQIIVFEALIRYMGGLLSAYELSGQKHPILLDKAILLGKRLMPAFDTPSGLFPHTWNPSRPKEFPNRGVLAADLSMHLELFTLSHHTKDISYAQKAQKITDLMERLNNNGGLYIRGLYPTGLHIDGGKFTDYTTRLGAMGDSWFEYLIKQYIMVDGTLEQYRDMYLESIDNIKKYVLAYIPGSDMIFAPPYNTQYKMRENTMDHLACFVPGMLALGAKTFDRPEDMELAKGSVEACMHIYRTSATGLGAEKWSFSGSETYDQAKYKYALPRQASAPPIHYQVDYQLPPKPNRLDNIHVLDGAYHLRPETLESLFVLYRLTGDQKYQEYGWEIFEAIEKNCKTASGYASIRNVDWIVSDNARENNMEDTMESFLLAETFKYLYLLFSPPDVISLDEYVFNTEAHPLLRKPWKWT
ncbi:glycosyl hydrolase family 47-domain-containing protein [Gongronella butleri]|nr:glycosyl hydrolase family 47-domain-containing protein [Gongronella butleri]